MTLKGVTLRHVPLLARMLFWRATLPIAKRLFSTERLVHLLATDSHTERSDDVSTTVRIAGRLWRSSDAPCLERSLAIYHELGRLGANPEFVLGFAREANGIMGHSWVELDGRALLESVHTPSPFVDVVRYAADGIRVAQRQ